MEKDRVLEEIIKYVETKGTLANKYTRAIFKGISFDDESQVGYYLVGEHRFELDFEEEVEEFQEKIRKATGKNFNLHDWAANPEESKEYEFLGEKVYSRE